MTLATSTLAQTLWPTATQNQLRNAALVIGGTCLIALGAHIQVPFYPVPMTMQTFAISVIAACYGLRLGVATVVAYLVEGAVGLPVFAGGASGIVHFFGPTAGFLFGFVLMAAIIGYAADQGWDKAWGKILAAMAVANLIVFVPGLAWLGTFTGFGPALITKGATPFIAATLFKTLLAASLMPMAWKLVQRLRG